MKKTSRRELPSKLTSFRLLLLYAAPLVLYFSYYPRLLLASSPSTNYELSLPLLWLALFALLSLKDFFLHLRYLFHEKSQRKYLLFYLFPLYLSLSALWSPNPLRAVLTSGILWCLIISAVGILFNLKNQSAFRKDLLGKTFLLSAVLLSLFCWLQCFLDVFLWSPLNTVEIPRTLTLLCPGCTSRVLGFPRPSGFAIEPQFMDNLLLAPTFYSFYLYFTCQNFTDRKQKLLSALLPTFLLTTFFLVFSRGAIYSFGVGFLVFLFLSWRKSQISIRRIFSSLVICFFSLALCLVAQGFFASSSATNDNFYTGIKTSLSQLSLGKIELPNSTTASPSTDSTAPSDSPAPSPVFSGYVAESTDIRLNLSRLALESSTETPTSLIFGYGLGSAGTVLYRQGKTDSTKEIVQNEYLSLLLETGLLGLFLLVLSLVLLIHIFLTSKTSSRTLKQSSKQVAKATQPASTLKQDQLFLSSLCLSFSLTLLFFSGLPNALHLYLFPVLLYTFMPFSSQTRTGHKPKS